MNGLLGRWMRKPSIQTRPSLSFQPFNVFCILLHDPSVHPLIHPFIHQSITPSTHHSVNPSTCPLNNASDHPIITYPNTMVTSTRCLKQYAKTKSFFEFRENEGYRAQGPAIEILHTTGTCKLASILQSPT